MAKDEKEKGSMKWLVIFAVLAFLAMLFLILMIGFALIFWIMLVIWIIFFLIFWFRVLLNFMYLVVLFVIALVLTLSFSFGVGHFGSTGKSTGTTGSSTKTYTCPDNAVHTKKAASGETVYYRCEMAKNSNGVPYAMLNVQIAEDIAGFPYNAIASATSTTNDRRLYCMTYKTGDGKESSCSSFFDYNPDPHGSRPGCSSPEDCYNKDSTKGTAPWVMPFVPNSITAVAYAALGANFTGIDSINQLIIYPFSMTRDYKYDQNDAPTKYPPTKTINLK